MVSWQEGKGDSTGELSSDFSSRDFHVSGDLRSPQFFTGKFKSIFAFEDPRLAEVQFSEDIRGFPESTSRKSTSGKTKNKASAVQVPPEPDESPENENAPLLEENLHVQLPVDWISKPSFDFCPQINVSEHNGNFINTFPNAVIENGSGEISDKMKGDEPPEAACEGRENNNAAAKPLEADTPPNEPLNASLEELEIFRRRLTQMIMSNETICQNIWRDVIAKLQTSLDRANFESINVNDTSALRQEAMRTLCDKNEQAPPPASNSDDNNVESVISHAIEETVHEWLVKVHMDHEGNSLQTALEGVGLPDVCRRAPGTTSVQSATVPAAIPNPRKSDSSDELSNDITEDKVCSGSLSSSSILSTNKSLDDIALTSNGDESKPQHKPVKRLNSVQQEVKSGAATEFKEDVKNSRTQRQRFLPSLSLEPTLLDRYPVTLGRREGPVSLGRSESPMSPGQAKDKPPLSPRYPGSDSPVSPRLFRERSEPSRSPGYLLHSVSEWAPRMPGGRRPLSPGLSERSHSPLDHTVPSARARSPAAKQRSLSVGYSPGSPVSPEYLRTTFPPSPGLPITENLLTPARASSPHRGPSADRRAQFRDTRPCHFTRNKVRSESHDETQTLLETPASHRSLSIECKSSADETKTARLRRHNWNQAKATSDQTSVMVKSADCQDIQTLLDNYKHIENTARKTLLYRDKVERARTRLRTSLRPSKSMPMPLSKSHNDLRIPARSLSTTSASYRSFEEQFDIPNVTSRHVFTALTSFPSIQADDLRPAKARRRILSEQARSLDFTPRSKSFKNLKSIEGRLPERSSVTASRSLDAEVVNTKCALSFLDDVFNVTGALNDPFSTTGESDRKHLSRAGRVRHLSESSATRRSQSLEAGGRPRSYSRSLDSPGHRAKTQLSFDYSVPQQTASRNTQHVPEIRQNLSLDDSNLRRERNLSDYQYRKHASLEDRGNTKPSASRAPRQLASGRAEGLLQTSL